MPLRIIAGQARGRTIKGPASDLTRPTSDKVRGAIFSTVESLLAVLSNLEAEQDAPDEKTEDEETADGAKDEAEESVFETGIWNGLRVLDLYAGTGALGIEALSRGADWADFVDSARPSARVVQENLRNLELAGRARVVSTRVENALARPADYRLAGDYSVCFLDPPYGDPTLARSLASLGEGGLLRSNALVVVETSRRFEIVGLPETLAPIKQKRHGDTVFHVLIYRA